MTEEVELKEDPLQIMEKNDKTDIVGESLNDISKQDILLCGKCHKVSYFVEEFQEHSLKEKCEESDRNEFIDTLKNDTKPQIWAFTLWKNTLYKGKEEKLEDRPKSWNLYQSWVNLQAKEKENWIKAAQSLQQLHDICFEFTKVKALSSLAKVYLVNSGDKSKDEETLECEDKIDDDDTDIASRLGKKEKDPLAVDGEQESEKTGKKTILKPVQLNNEVVLVPKKGANTKKARRTGSSPAEDYVVEKIVSKRYNPRKKTFEYLLKWENFDSEKNTWEPHSNLQSCKAMLDEFEKKFIEQKAQQKLAKSNEKKSLKKAELAATPGGRPQRTCKQKALNQVKQWCGNMEADENTGKRLFSDDSDEDATYDKRMKYDGDSSDSENETPVVTIKRISKSTNGVDRKSRSETITLPDNILIPDSKGIVRINQKQIPSLSSGVYVMSKTAGIIKLDTNASKLATAGGHTVLKVAPKIGQTSIKVIKKDMPNGNLQRTGINKQKTAVRSYSNTNKVFLQKKQQQMVKKSSPDPFVVQQSKHDDDDDSDGIEELEFPTDIPLPAPDSPPASFTLCPLTGKVIDKDGVPIEPEPLPEPEPKDIVRDTAAALDNLVKMAAADILQDIEGTPAMLLDVDVAIKKESVEEIDESPVTVNLGHAPSIVKQEVPAVTTVTTPVISKTIVRPTLTPTSHNTVTRIVRPVHHIESKKPTVSILSTALTNANIPTIRRVHPATLLQRPTPPKNMHNRTVPPKPTPQAIITRITPGNNTPRSRMMVPKVKEVVRKKQQLQAQRLNQPTPQVVHRTMINPHLNNPQLQRSLVKRIGDTRVYSPARQQQKKVQLPVPPLAAVSSTFAATTPTTTGNSTISMPSLLLTTVPEPQETTPTPVAATPTEATSTEAEEPMEAQEDAPATSAETSGGFDLNSLALNDSDEGPLLITGEDGTIYQVAGQNDEGQTILITQGEDGEQQCLLVAPENAGEINQALMKPHQVREQMEAAAEEDQPLSVNTESDEPIDDSQVVAQIVSAQPPSPGGTRKVVLMLPDGNFMMTEVTADQYAALELDK